MSNRLEHRLNLGQNRGMKCSNVLKRLCASALALLAAPLLFPQGKKNVVTGIAACASGANTISVSWKLPEENSRTISSFLIYRTARPVTSYRQLEFIEPAASAGKNETLYIDTPRSPQDYFYTVITVTGGNSDSGRDPELYYDEQLDSRLDPEPGQPVKLVLPGVNATTEGVKAAGIPRQPSIQKEAAQKKTGSGKMREMPLPYVDIFKDEKKNNAPQISGAAKKAVRPLLRKSSRSASVLSAHIFEEDLISPAGGDEYLLFEILRTSFVKKKYSQSAAALEQFLAQNRTKAVSDRANFYLGESYYFTGNFSSALTRFLSLEETYPELSRKWTESTLDNFSAEGE